MSQGEFRMDRRTFVTLAGASAGTTSVLAGCSAISTTRKPTYSYASITGVWTGDTYSEEVFVHDRATVEFTTGRATPGEEIGTLRLVDENRDEAHCGGSTLALHSDPPSSRADVEGDGFPRRRFVRCRFGHEPETGQLLRVSRSDTENFYGLATTPTREGGRAG